MLYLPQIYEKAETGMGHRKRGLDTKETGRRDKNYRRYNERERKN